MAKTATKKAPKKTAAKTETKTDDAPKKHPVKASNVKHGHLMAFTYYGTIETVHTSFNGQAKVDVMDVDRGTLFQVSGTELIEAAKSADQYQEEEKSTKTKVAEMLINSHNIPFTVCFEKQPDKDGNVEERTLRGRLIAPEPLLGRSMVEDLDIKSGHKIRQIDHRTIKWMIVNGVKYVVK